MSSVGDMLTVARDYWFILAPAGAGAAYLARIAYRLHHAIVTAWKGIVEKVTRIDEALGPNGGKSVVDRLQRIEDGQKGAATEMAWMRARSDADQRTATEPRLELDARGQVTMVNRSFEGFVDRGAGDVIGRGFIGVVHPEDRDRVVREWQHAVEDQRWFESALRLLPREGRVRWVRMYAEPMRARAGNEVLGWLVMFIESADAQQGTK